MKPIPNQAFTIGKESLAYRGAVSYTHLDVYKRQDFGNGEKSANRRIPVSVRIVSGG